MELYIYHTVYIFTQIYIDSPSKVQTNITSVRFFTFTICPFSDETTLEAGIRVQIHSQSEPPYIHQLGFGVSPGFQTFVSCQEQRVGLTGVKTIKNF